MSPARIKRQPALRVTSISLSNTKHGKLAYLKQASFIEDSFFHSRHASMPLFHAFKYVYAFSQYLK